MINEHNKISACFITDGADLPKLTKAVFSVFSSCFEVIICANKNFETVKEIFQNFKKVKVYEQVWEKDFALARNQCIEKCKGEWILILDSDEELETPIEFLNPEYDAYYVTLNSNKVYNVIGELVHRSFRVFKNNPLIRFENKLHEKVDRSIVENNFKFAISNIVINHSGYEDSEVLKKKEVRNIEVMKHDTDNPENNFNLSRHYLTTGEYDKCLEVSFEVLNDEKSNNDIKAIVCLIAADAYKLGYRANSQCLKMLMQSIFYVSEQIRARVSILEELQLMDKDGAKEKALEQMKVIQEINNNRSSKLPFDFYYQPEILTKKLNEIEKWH